MVYETIKRIAEEKGLSIAKIEKAAGLSAGAIGKWAKCSPSLENARAVSSVLGCTVDDLIREEQA